MKKRSIKSFFALLAVLFTLAPAALFAGTGAVLFDNAHLESIGNANWTITGGFSDFADTIAGMGYRVEEIKNGAVTPEILKKYDAFIIPEPNVKFTPEEEAAIVDYVKNGGSLYMIADHQGADRNNDGWDAVKIFNNFCQPFGMKFADKWIKKEMPIRGKFEQTDITYKVKYCGTWGGTTVDILDPAIAKGHIFVSDQNGAGAYIATAEYGKGRVVAFGDSSPFDDGFGDKGAVDLTDGYNLLDADHRQLAVNTMCYLFRMNPAEHPMKLRFYYEGGKLNAKEGEKKEFPLVLVNQDAKELSNITIDFYRNRPFDPKTKFHSITVEKITPGEKMSLALPFMQSERMMFTMYTTVACQSDKAANIVGFNSIMVGVPMMVFIDSFHQNDYVNRVKMLKNAFEEEGIFYTRTKFAYSDQFLAKTDILIITPPKQGFAPAAEEIVALMNHLKKGRGGVFVGKGPDSNWGSNEIANELMKSAGVPAKFVAHPECQSGNGKCVKYSIADNALIKIDGVTEIKGESPAAVEIDAEAAKKAGIGVTTVVTLPGSQVPVGVIFDYSKTSTGLDRVAVFGSFHFSDQSYDMDLSSPTHRFNMRLLRVLSPKQPAFASQAPAGPANSGGSNNAPASNEAPRPAGNFVRGIAKAYAGGVLYIADFGVTKEIRMEHELTEKAALEEFAKFKGRLVKVNLKLMGGQLITGGFDMVEYRK